MKVHKMKVHKMHQKKSLKKHKGKNKQKSKDGPTIRHDSEFKFGDNKPPLEQLRREQAKEREAKRLEARLGEEVERREAMRDPELTKKKKRWQK